MKKFFAIFIFFFSLSSLSFGLTRDELLGENTYYKGELERNRYELMAFMLDHSMATSALMAAGGGVAGNIDETIDQDTKNALTGIGLIGAAYCIYNFSECAEVTQIIISSSTKIKGLQSKLDSLQTQLSVSPPSSQYTEIRCLIGFNGEDLQYFMYDGQKFEYGVRIVSLMDNMSAKLVGLQSGDVL